MSMGMTKEMAEAGLRNTDNNMERAVDWIFSHPDGEELPQEGGSAAAGGGGNPAEGLTNGEPRYELVGFISHMGGSVHAGHYVVHVKKNDRWLIYNDNKVLLSEKPPKDLGYLYLYKRIN